MPSLSRCIATRVRFSSSSRASRRASMRSRSSTEASLGRRASTQRVGCGAHGPRRRGDRQHLVPTAGADRASRHSGRPAVRRLRRRPHRAGGRDHRLPGVLRGAAQRRDAAHHLAALGGRLHRRVRATAGRRRRGGLGSHLRRPVRHTRGSAAGQGGAEPRRQGRRAYRGGGLDNRGRRPRLHGARGREGGARRSEREGRGQARRGGAQGAEALVRDRHARVPQTRRAHRGGQRVDRLDPSGEADPHRGERDDPGGAGAHLVAHVRAPGRVCGRLRGLRRQRLVGPAHQRAGPVCRARGQVCRGVRIAAHDRQRDRTGAVRAHGTGAARDGRHPQALRGVAPTGSALDGANTALMLSVRAIVRIVLVVVCVAIALYLLWLLRKPISWLLIAIFLAVALSPPVNWLARRMRRGFAITIVYLGLLLIPILLIAAIVPPLITEANNFADNVPTYADDVTEFVQKNKQLREINQDYDITAQLEKEAKKLPNRLGGAAGTLRDVGLGIVNSVFALITILVLTAFLLGSGRSWTDALIASRPPEQRERLHRSLDNMASAVGGYVAGALTIAVIAGVATYIVLAILGVPFKGPLAVLAGLFSLIPLVGATIAAVLIGIVTLFEDFPTATIIWTIWAIAYQQLENHLLQPQIQKRTVNVHPLITILAVLFGGTLLGILGAIVAIPVAASIQILLREYVDMRTLSIKSPEAPPPAAPPPPDPAPA